jgi:hypothetical protein
MAAPKIEGERTELKGGLFQYVTVGEGGQKLITFWNSTKDVQFNVAIDFGQTGAVEPVGEAKKEGTKVAVVVYPEETRQLARGAYTAWKRALSFGAPDKAWQAKKASAQNSAIEEELNAVKDLIRANPRPDKRYSAEYVAGLCETQRTKFVDITFPPRSSSIARDFEISGQQQQVLMWMRPYYYCDTQSPCLYVGEIEPGDIDQGNLGDCYLMCGLACLSEFPGLVKEVFCPKQNFELGIYRARVCKNGWWQICVVDDLLPINPATRKPIYAKNREEPHELWVSIMEKVYAKLYGSYAAIRSGDPALALGDLTGWPYQRFAQIPLWSEDKDAFFQFLKRCDESDYIMTVCTPGSDTSATSGAKSDDPEKNALADKYKAVGLCTGHAFSLIRVKEVEGHRLCMIRNPWGNDQEWNGDWSDNSPLWTPAIQEAVGFSKADDGTFWMAWEDVVTWFDSGSVTYVMPSWCQCRVAGNFDDGIPDVAIQLDVHLRTTLWLGAHQRDTRGVAPGDKDAKYAGLQLAVLQANDRGTSNVIAVSASNFVIARDAFVQVDLEPSPRPYFVILQAFQDITKSFVMSLFAENPYAISVSFVAYPESAKAKYNPVSSCKLGLLTEKVAAHYQILTPSSPTPVERTADLVDFSAVKTAGPPVAAKIHRDPNAPVVNPPPKKTKKLKLSVTVVSGTNLVAKDDNGLSDPYVTLTLCDASGKRYADVDEQSTAYINETLNPVWGEVFTLEVLHTDIVVAECWDKDLFGRDAMGSCRFQVGQVAGLLPGGPAVVDKRPLKGGDATGELQFLLKLE